MSIEQRGRMIAMLVIAPLLCAQVTLDAPSRSASLTDVKTRPAWVEPSLWVMGASAALPLVVTAALVSAGFNLVTLAIGGMVAVLTSRARCPRRWARADEGRLRFAVLAWRRERWGPPCQVVAGATQ